MKHPTGPSYCWCRAAVSEQRLGPFTLLGTSTAEWAVQNTGVTGMDFVLRADAEIFLSVQTLNGNIIGHLLVFSVTSAHPKASRVHGGQL